MLTASPLHNKSAHRHLFPNLINPLKKTKEGWSVPDSERAYAALLFAKIFSEGRDALIEALPKIQRHLQGRFRNPQAMTEMVIALHNEIIVGQNQVTVVVSYPFAVTLSPR